MKNDGGANKHPPLLNFPERRFLSAESVGADGTLEGCMSESYTASVSPDQTLDLSSFGFVPPFTVSVSGVQ